jgi:hypothetical protein
MKEAIPGLAKIALIINMSDADGVKRYIEVAQEPSKPLGVTLGRFAVREVEDFDGWANLLKKSIPEWPRRADLRCTTEFRWIVGTRPTKRTTITSCRPIQREPGSGPPCCGRS